MRISNSENLKIRLLGTGAGDAIPAPFCSCDTCMKTRELGGKNIRMRSMAQIDDDIYLDFSQDVVHQSIKFNLELWKAKGIFFTHSHIDHLASEEICLRYRWYSNQTDENPLKLFLNDNCRKVTSDMVQFDTGETDPKFLEFNKLENYKTVFIENVAITPIPANHAKNEDDFVFLVEKNEKRVLYCLDTAMLSEESIDFLKNKKLDAVFMDSTYVHNRETGNTHMGFIANCKLRDIFYENNTAVKETIFVLTHISHSCEMTHDELLKTNTENFIVAYDGYEITL